MIRCSKCGLDQKEQDVKQERIFLPNNRDYHLKASCGGCGAYITFLSHDPVPKLHFGKYSGWAIAEINRQDPGYIRWLLQQDIKPRIRKSILKVVDV